MSETPQETTDNPTPATQKPRNGRVRSIITWTIVGGIAIAGSVYAWRTVQFYEHHAETDDAFVEAHIDPVLPRIAGYVTAVNVRDNQAVKQGDVLVTIDTQDLQAKLHQAQGAVETSKAKVAAAEAQVSVMRANTTALATQKSRTHADLDRYAKLREKQDIPQQMYDTARSAADNADAQLVGTERQVGAAQAQVAAARAEVDQKQADVAYAELQVTYGTVAAPATGTISKRNVENGQMVQSGQPLMAIVLGDEPWVIANFKETQLQRMRQGQKVELEVDAYPKHTFHGQVDSFAAATGAKFSLLPPDNATGNFTKVVQRVPVKIVFTDPADPTHPLRAGMSVTAIVNLD
ncbi:MAG: HlyD family secretion protein [Acidobacteriota bacterium]